MISKTSDSDRPSIDEKKQADPEAVLETVSASASTTSHEIDFGGDSQLPPPPKLTPEQEKRLYRKVDLWLMPILTLMYLASFLDRGNIGNAKLQGLTTQLNLTGNKYNIALTMYFVWRIGIFYGGATIAVLVDFPNTARFLTPEERSYIIWKKRYDNSSVGETETFAVRHVWAAFKDWQVWLHILIYMSIIGPLYGISLFLPSIINGFGFNTAISQLLTVPPYFVAIWSDRIKMRYPFILAGLFLCLIGFSINISKASVGAKYLGTFFCVSGSYAAFPGIVSWLGNNLSGQYKRGVGMALHIGIGNFAGAIASNIYRTQDAPRYILGHGLELMFVGIGFVTLPMAVFLYIRINASRDRLVREMKEKGIKLSAEEIRELGDRAPDFRYTL
ncbi:hypothetical protein EIP86_009203 [Pleurotus ostreatoroseus]|nr:hypothetical protein EIP86_009203 [Pleurotus ostreatoroseus]